MTVVLWGEPEVLVARIVDHLEVMVSQACGIGGVRPRVMWGGVVASVAGAFTRAIRASPHAARPVLERTARAVCSSAMWPGASALVTWTGVPDDPDIPSYRRNSCCLIFLSPDHEECSTCPRKERLLAS